MANDRPSTGDRARASGGAAHVHPCDLTDSEDIARMAAEVLAEHARVDILVNNAGRSIRRSVANSYDRLHDYERTIQLNYLGAVALIVKVLPGMRERRSGQIVNVSTMGLQVNTPRFSAYLASKAALDAFSRSIASEIVDDGVSISTVRMPLVRTPMIEPTGFDQPGRSGDDDREGDRQPADEAVDRDRPARRDHLWDRAEGPGRGGERRVQARSRIGGAPGR